MSDFMFGMGDGHLPKKAAKIAERHGARLVNYTEPNGRQRYWFAAPNLGNPQDQLRAKAVRADLEKAGIW
jgi:hypothetical protein